MRRTITGVMVAAGLALAGPASAQRAGPYEATGINPDGSSYTGQYLMRQVGLSSWQILWQINDARIEGFGMSSGNTFAVGFTLGSRPGIAIYTVLPDGKLTGQWTMIGSSAIGTETLTPVDPSPAAPAPGR